MEVTSIVSEMKRHRVKPVDHNRFMDVEEGDGDDKEESEEEDEE